MAENKAPSDPPVRIVSPSSYIHLSLEDRKSLSDAIESNRPGLKDTKPAEDFPLFSFCPSGIQQMIWRRALPPPRVITLSCVARKGPLLVQAAPRTHSSIPNLIKTCKAAKMIVAQHYSPFPPFNIAPGGRQILYNGERDTVFISKVGVWELLDISNDLNSVLVVHGIRNLAAGGHMLKHFIDGTINIERLKRVIFCVTRTDNQIGAKGNSLVPQDNSKQRWIRKELQLKRWLSKRARLASVNPDLEATYSCFPFSDFNDVLIKAWSVASPKDFKVGSSFLYPEFREHDAVLHITFEGIEYDWKHN